MCAVQDTYYFLIKIDDDLFIVFPFHLTSFEL